MRNPARWKTVATTLLALAVLAFAAAALHGLWPRLTVTTIRALPFAGAVAAYVAAVVASGMWWWFLLDACGARVPLGRAIAAYCAGTAGKYVPGKAASIALRALWSGASTPMAATAAVLEALSTAAVGGAAGVALLAIAAPPSSDAATLLDAHTKVVVAGCACVALAGVAVLAIVAPRIAKVQVSASARRRLLYGAPLTLVSWAIMALSQLACFAALDVDVPPPLFVAGAIATANAVGFVLPVPAGIGARELALVTVLTHGGVDGEHALAAALLARAISVGADVAMLAAGALFVGRYGTGRNHSSPVDDGARA